MDQSNSSIEGLIDWNPRSRLRAISSKTYLYSKGFLRSRPDKWFPNIAPQWVTLAHSLGAGLRLVDVSPTLDIPSKITTMFSGLLDEASLGIAYEKDAEYLVPSTILGHEHSVGGALLREYIARRLFSSLAQAFSSKTTLFHSDIVVDPTEFIKNVEACLRVSFAVGGRSGTIWILLSKELVENLDGLWRRQIRSSTHTLAKGGMLDFEIAQLSVPQDMASEYKQVGSVVDLEVPVSDLIGLRLNGRPWFIARCVSIDGTLGFEITARQASEQSISENSRRFAIRFPPMELNGPELAEVSQPGAIIKTNNKLSNSVRVYIDNEHVSNATLQVYEQRFAITVN
jgi:flagellar motor switch/type III secretory pathway protein FliN